MKICVITPRYMISGVALAQHRFARALAEAGHDVDLVIGRSEPDLTVPDIAGARIIVLDRPNVRSMMLPLWRYMRRVKPDVIFSAEDHLNALVLLTAILSGSKARISGSSRVTPFDTYSSRPLSKRWFLKHIMRLVTWRADALTCVSRDMVDQYRQVFKAPPHVCVYNIVANAEARRKIAEPLDDPWFTERDCPMVVAAGTLAPWKGFADLIDAAAILKGRGRRFRVGILGEGPLRGELQAQIDRLGLSDTVRLVGRVANPYKYYARSNVFALSSHVEGLPNVLVEAMMAGCTPVAADCPTGPKEVLQDGRYGYLVRMRDPEALADGIAQAFDRPLGREVLEEGTQPFVEAAVVRRHFELLGLSGGA